MPNYKTALATAQDAAKIDLSQRPDIGLYGGRVHHRRVQYTLIGTEAATETIKICDLPAGARVLSEISKVTPSADPGTALVIDIGTAGDPDAFSDGLVLSAGEKAVFDAPAVPIGANGDRRMGDSNLGTDLAVYATFMTATALTAAVVLNFDLFFVVPE